MDDSPFIPPMPSPYGAQRGVIPSPRSDDQPVSPGEQSSTMRRMPPRGAYPYAAFSGAMHTPAYLTPGVPWGPGILHSGAQWPPFQLPVYGPPGPPVGAHPHSTPFLPGQLPPGATPYPYHHPTPYLHPHAYPGPFMPGSAPMGPVPMLYPEEMVGPFPDRPTEDGVKIDQWATGSHYAPVLTPLQHTILNATLSINPLLAPAGENPPPDRAFLHYNVLFPVSTARRSTDPPSRSWSAGRHSPATFPRLTNLRIVSRDFPWALEIEASRKAHGVTCFDVINGIYEGLQATVSRQQIMALSGPKGDNHRRKLFEVYHYNRSTARDAPGGSMGDGVRRADWLLNNVMYDGLVDDPKFVQEKLGIAGPGWKSLKKKPEEGDKAKEAAKPLGWPATLVLKLDLRYGGSEADGESTVTSDTEQTEMTEESQAS